MHEALRGRRRVREIVCTREAAAAMPWLESSGVRMSLAVADRVTALAERPDHQGVVAICDPYPYADAETLLAAPDALVVALDGVTDPRNLGAIARSCECLGAHGLVIPRHGSAGVTAVVAKASSGAVEHLPIAIVTNLAELLRRSKRADLWSYAAAEDGEATPDALDLTGGVVLVLGLGGLRDPAAGAPALRCAACASRCTAPSARSTSRSPHRCCCTKPIASAASRA